MSDEPDDTPATVVVDAARLERLASSALRRAGASEASLAAAVRAMMHASLHGIDSHGVRLTEHYCRMLCSGRIKRAPELRVEQSAAASAMIDADDGLGHYASYRAVEVGCRLAAAAGIAGVGVRRSSHYGAAGAYALAGAQQGFICFSTTNSDSMVALHNGAERFHGTNPLALAAPVPGRRPWLLDMATSSIPMNRVLLYLSLGKELPMNVAADRNGSPSIDPKEVEMLLPLGGAEYGYKGAGLAGMATLLSAVLTGGVLDSDAIPMYDDADQATPRNIGHFFWFIDPSYYVGRSRYEQGILRYLESLRAAPARAGTAGVMAPGDREWRIAEQRSAHGIPIDQDTARFLGAA